MLKKSALSGLIMSMIIVLLFGISANAATDYTNGVADNGSTSTIWFKSNVNTTWVNVHYTVNSGAQQNLSMTYNASLSRYERAVSPVTNGQVISYWFTYNNGTPAYDTSSFSHTVGSGSSGAGGVVSGVTYKLINSNSGKALDVNAAGTTDGTNVQIWTDNGSAAQQWLVTSNGDGTYKLTNPNSGKALDVSGAGTANGTNVQIWTANGSAAQKWQISSNGDGTFRLINPNSAKALDVSNSGTANGSNVQIWTDNGTGAQKWQFVQVSTGGGGTSIGSISASSIPAPTGSGVLSVKIMNGTNGVYADNQIYWGVLGINPANGLWSYLDLNGNLLPISNTLNDAPGHLTKNGVNYANIYHKVSDAAWVSLPKITSGRMFLSVGSPTYIKTFDTGFAGPSLTNPSDPNVDVYYDFVEFTVDNAGYHGNVTRVDGFGFPIQHRLVNKAGNFDQTVGELESETRAGLFAKYQNEVPAAFKSLATAQAPYRIIAPIHGSFAAGGANANYFAGYSGYSTQDILRCDGALTNAQACAAINRHVYTDSNWNIVGNYYKATPANYYAKFWHDHSINGLAYGFAYDDVNGQAAYLEIGDPKGMILRVAW